MVNLLVIPSIDIKNGKTVRVVQGIPELDCKIYGDDPVEMAKLWRAENAKMIHVVDFDLSHQHSHKNYRIIEKMCNNVVIPVEVGGGISSLEEAREVFNLGVFRIVIGSLAYTNENEFKKILDYFGPQRIVAAIDVLDNQVVVSGRSKKTGMDPIDYSKKLTDIGVKRFIVTDVYTNGMLEGPNISLSESIAKATKQKVTLSGGIRNYPDLVEVKKHMNSGIDSVIVGRALYENKFPCQKIWRVAESKFIK